MPNTHFIYAYPYKDGKHIYYELPELGLNDGNKTVEALKLKEWCIGAQIVKQPGYIFEAETENSTVRYSKKPAIVSVWENKQDRIEWSAKRAAFDNIKALKNEVSENMLRKHLEPIRGIYESHPDYKTKRYILAEVIRIITG